MGTGIGTASSIGLGGALGGSTGALSGLFKDTGEMFFGNNETSSQSGVDPSTQRYIDMMRMRQDELWPLLKELIGDQSGQDQAYAGIPEELQAIINSSKQGAEDVSSFNLDPKALAFLDSMRDERIGSIRGDMQDLFGSAVSDLAKRGVTSSSVAENVIGRELPRAAEGMISKANEDYYNSRLNLPSQIATTKAGMNNNTASLLGQKYDFASKRYSDKMAPLFNLWSLTSPAGMVKGQEQSGTEATPGMLSGLMSGLGSGLGASLGKGCWVAREVFGQDNYQWRQFREWLYTMAPAWFKNLYLKHGERFAEYIRNKPRVKSVIRMWMVGRIKTLMAGRTLVTA